jgi:peptidoglycan hydrolase-like protein with peptidoglycan-binding domain
MDTLKSVVCGFLALFGLANCSGSSQPAPAPVPEPAPIPAPSPAPHHPLGTHGVMSLQRALNLKGFHLKEDGWAGAHTTAALKQFQQQTGIQPANGQIDDQTWSALGLSEGS